MKQTPSDWLEDGLETYPIAVPPPDLSARILRSVRQSQGSRAFAPARFRLTWMDYALGLLSLVVTGLVVFLLPLLPPIFWLRLRFAWLLLQSPSMQPVLLSLAVGGALLAGLALAGLLAALAQMNRRTLWPQ